MVKKSDSVDFQERFERTLGGVTGLGGTPLDRRPPVILARGAGSHVWDTEGKEFIDYTQGGGSLQLGYGHPGVVEAVKEAHASPPRVDEEKANLVEKIFHLFPQVESVRFLASESEAVHAAIRLARGVNPRNKVLRFEGHYHGWFDNVAWDSNHPHAGRGPRETARRYPVSRGQTGDDSEDIILIPWNDLELLERVLDEHSAEISCLISEPVIAFAGIPPLEGFLPGVEALCRKHRILFILDERLTGFRWAVGGAQAYYDIQADLTLFSHVMDGGLPLAAIGGRKEIFQTWDRIYPPGVIEEPGVLSFVAGNATLKTLFENQAELLTNAWVMSDRLAKGIQEIGDRSGLPLSVRSFPCCFQGYFPRIRQEEIIDARTYEQTDSDLLFEWILALEERGILISPSGGWGVTSVHSLQDIGRTLERAEEVVGILEERHSR